MTSQDSGIETGNDSNDSYHAPQESKDTNQIKMFKCNVGPNTNFLYTVPAVNSTLSLNSPFQTTIRAISVVMNKPSSSNQSEDVSDVGLPEVGLGLSSSLPTSTEHSFNLTLDPQEMRDINLPMFRLPTPRSIVGDIEQPQEMTDNLRMFRLPRSIDIEPPAGLSFRNLQPTSLGLGHGYELVVGPGLRKMRTCHCRCPRRRTPRDTWMQFKIPLDERKLRTAVSVNNMELVESLLASGVNPNTSDVHKRSPLHLAACRGYAKIVKMLLDKGASPNLKDSLGNTPLHLAACTNNVEVVTLLIKAGADLSSGDNSGRNPLQIAQSKLKLLQQVKNKSEEVSHIKAEVAQVVEMMQTFLQKRGQDMEAELLNAFSSRLSLSDTPAKVETDVRDLLASLSGLSIDQPNS